MSYLKIKFAGIYKIEHQSGFYYIGMSKDVFSRWQSHYTNIVLNKHSSVKFSELWNKTTPEEWSFEVLEKLSTTEERKKTILKGREFDKHFRRLLLDTEKKCMNKFSKKFALNKDVKHFL
jgi:predicted GIY-YIG superfamily endonuclease